MSNFSIIEQDINSQIRLLSITVTIDKEKSNASAYKKYLEKTIQSYDELFKYTNLLHGKDIKQLEETLEEKTNNIFDENVLITPPNSNVSSVDMFKEQYINEISELKRHIDNSFYKFFPQIQPQINNENPDELDKELMDKISAIVPEGKEVLLKNIVKELNGSAKGLSDFVILFTKYRQSIINYNGIEYFQRKGCHFLRKI